MELEEAVRTRRTHKVFGSDPVDRDTLEELFELARWAPNHHLTNPWRFHVLGARTRGALEEAAEAEKPGSAVKLRRAPTLVVLAAVRDSDPSQDRDDLLATAMAGYLVLLGAHARGLASYWRTLAVLDTPAGRAAISLPEDQEPVGLLHLGRPRQEQFVPERAPVEDVVRYLE
ncbi:MAG TPA: nitroreductase family protein [Solirubrobacteraceae bacterium]|jgi:nitroreductase|nr:nitroreductase family protein [Solirubrobacteraceae bacterium]